MNNQEAAAHIRKRLDESSGPFVWPTDGAGYAQHIKFVKWRNSRWTDECAMTWREFVLDYASRLERDDPHIEHT